MDAYLNCSDEVRTENKDLNTVKVQDVLMETLATLTIQVMEAAKTVYCKDDTLLLPKDWVGVLGKSYAIRDVWAASS